VRIVDTQHRMPLLEELRCPGLKGQRAARKVATEIAPERRPADLVAALDPVACGVLALPGLRGVPEA